LTNVDGTTKQAGTILKYSNLECTYQRRQKETSFLYNKPRKGAELIFGMPWFQSLNPEIDWKEAKLKGRVELSNWKSKAS